MNRNQLMKAIEARIKVVEKYNSANNTGFIIHGWELLAQKYSLEGDVDKLVQLLEEIDKTIKDI